MNMDLSWSHHLRTDAPTLVKEIRSEVKRHMDHISSYMFQFDNVHRALNEGNRVLANTLCRKCLENVKSKRMEIHAKNYTSHKKKKLMKLSPEYQQIVNEMTNAFMKIERSQSENPGNEEYCTQEDYYQQEMAEMQNLHIDKIMNIQVEIEEMENKYKKEVKDKEAEVRDLRKQLEKMTPEKDIFKKDNDQMSKRLKSYEKTESELRELKNNHKRLTEDMDRKECIINKLKRDLELKEEDNRRYRRSSPNILTRSFGGNRDNELTSFKEELNSKDAEVQTSMTERENLKTEQYELLQRIRNLQEENNSLKKTIDSQDEEIQKSRIEHENLILEREEFLQRNRNLKEETNSLKYTIGSRDKELQTLKRQKENLKSEQDELLQQNQNLLDEELQTSRRENENLKSERDELLQRNRNLQEETNFLKETIDSTDEELQTSMSQTETLKSDQGDFLQRNRNLQEEKNCLRKTTDLRDEELQTSRRENENLKSERDELLQRNRNLKEETNLLKETTGKHADKSYTEEKEQDEKEISQPRAEIQILQDQECILHKRNVELSSTMENLQRDVTWLIERLERTQGDLDKLKKQNEETVRDIAHLQTEKQTQHGQTCSLNKANEVLSTNMEGLQQDIKRLTEKSVKKDEEINKLKLSLVDYRRLEKKLLVMRLMCSKQSELDKGIMDMVTKELIRHLEGRIDSNSIEFAIVHCETSTDISYGPLFVLCLNMSREDRYIRDALEETKGGTDVYVLVLHNSNKELTPTRLRVTGGELRQDKVIDLAFRNDMGLYDCNLNIEGIEKIVSVLKKF